MPYCTPEDVSLVGGIRIGEDVSETVLTELIKKATAKVNADMSSLALLEHVDYIDSFRENRIDGSNRRFYTKNSYKYAMGDLNDDGTLTAADIEVYLLDNTTNERTQVLATTLSTDGQFEVEIAPTANVSIYVTYRYQPFTINPVHPLVREATANLTAAYVRTNIGADNFKAVNIGRMRYVRDDSVGLSWFLKQYEDFIRKIDWARTRILAPGQTYLSLDFEDIE
jgi:hypothetical protein